MALDAAIALIDELLAGLRPAASREQNGVLPISAVSTTSEGAAGAKSPGQKAKKAKQKSAADPAQKQATDTDDPFSKALIQVGKVTAVEQFESDKLYCCQVAFAGGSSKQIVAGLKKHLAVDELLEHLVVVILNLKTAKLAGRLSEGMILAAVHTNADGSEMVHPLHPHGDSIAGDVILAEGILPAATPPKQLKSDVWRSIAAELKTVKGRASYRGAALHSRSGPVLVHSSIPDNSVIR